MPQNLLARGLSLISTHDGTAHEVMQLKQTYSSWLSSLPWQQRQMGGKMNRDTLFIVSLNNVYLFIAVIMQNKENVLISAAKLLIISRTAKG